MHTLLLSAMLILCPAPQDAEPASKPPDAATDRPEVPPPPSETRVIAAVAKAARENAALDEKKRRAGDALFDHYVRTAAAEADDDARAFLVGLAIALDPDGTIEKSPFVGHHFRGKETKAAAKARRLDLGNPTLHGRSDLARHFTVSGAMAVLLDARFSEQAGYLKENADAQEGGSGYSLKDVLANLAGIHLAVWLTEASTKERMQIVVERFTGPRFMPDPKDQPEGLDSEGLLEHCEETDGSWPAKQRALKASVAALPVYGTKKREAKKEEPGKGD